MSFIEFLEKFKKELAKRGHPTDIVWLQANQLLMSSKCLYVYSEYGFPYEKHIQRAYEKFEADSECGVVLMLVYENDQTSYCTLLLDSFGSNDDIEIEDGKYYLWCNPYVKSVKLVHSKLKWLYLEKLTNKRVLSSLDYACLINKELIT